MFACVGISHTNKQTKLHPEGIFLPGLSAIGFARNFARLYSVWHVAAAAENNSLVHFCPLSLFSKLPLFSCLLLISPRAGTGKMHAGQCLLLSLPGTAELEQ